MARFERDPRTSTRQSTGPLQAVDSQGYAQAFGYSFSSRMDTPGGFPTINGQMPRDLHFCGGALLLRNGKRAEPTIRQTVRAPSTSTPEATRRSPGGGGGAMKAARGAQKVQEPIDPVPSREEIQQARGKWPRFRAALGVFFHCPTHGLPRRVARPADNIQRHYGREFVKEKGPGPPANHSGASGDPGQGLRRLRRGPRLPSERRRAHDLRGTQGFRPKAAAARRRSWRY